MCLRCAILCTCPLTLLVCKGLTCTAAIVALVSLGQNNPTDPIPPQPSFHPKEREPSQLGYGGNTFFLSCFCAKEYQ